MLLIAALGVGLRFVFLNADPAYPEWIGYITDEGRWVGIARDIVLFGRHEPTALSTLHMAMAPLYQVLAWASFELFGVDFWTARLVSAISGSSVLLIAALFLRRIGATSITLGLPLAILAFQPDLVFLSRIAIPEMTAVLVYLAAFLLIMREKSTSASLFFAGLISVVGLAVKATTFPLVPVFLIIAAFNAGRDPRERIRCAAAYAAGVAIPGVLGLVAIFSFGGIQGILDNLAIVGRFIDISSVYGVMGFLIENRFAQPVNLLLLIAWCVGILLHFEQANYDSRMGRIYVASAIWVSGWIAIASLMAYFPSRYILPVLVPLSIHLCAGLSLLSARRPETREVAPLLKPSPLAAAAIALPVAVLLTPLLVGLIDDLIPGAIRLRGRLATIFAATVTIGIVARRCLASEQSRTAATLLPLLMAFGWAITVGLNLLPPHFWASAANEYVATWAAILATAIIVSVAAVYWPRVHDDWGRLIGATSAFALSALFLIQLAPTYLDRHYTIRNASVDLGQVLGDASRVVSDSAESLFLANRILYSTDGSGETPSHIVVAFERTDKDQAAGYEQSVVYPLYAHPDYSAFDATASRRQPVIIVYQLDAQLF